jgi:uncharacterized protein YcbK (DUF882 family)
MAYVSNEELFPVWREPRSFWERTGLTPRQRRRLDVAMVAIVVLLMGGWIYSVADALRTGAAPQMALRIGTNPTPLSSEAGPSAAFLLDAALQQLVTTEDSYRGHSRQVRVIVNKPGDSLPLPDTLPGGVELGYGPAGTPGAAGSAAPPATTAPSQPGLWNVLLRMQGAMRPIPNLSLVTLVPRSQLNRGRIGSYMLGSWPEKGGIYAPPQGFVQVTPENMNTYVSEHIQLKYFLTKGQEGVWPKYIAMSPQLLDKLELTFQEMKNEGHPVDHVFAISGFRTPSYNESGGDPSGRAALSRHMYGDAMDVTIDNDRDGMMDDLNGDGRVTVADARVLAQAAQRVEQKYPDLVGGIGIYSPTGAHHGFVHIDTRGYRARWGAW